MADSTLLLVSATLKLRLAVIKTMTVMSEVVITVWKEEVSQITTHLVSLKMITLNTVTQLYPALQTKRALENQLSSKWAARPSR